MKSLLLIISIASFSVASAQNGQPPKVQKINPYTNKKAAPVKPLIQNTPVYNATPLMILPNGNRVVALSQDNMPCIVPDMKQFSMPNTGTPIYPYKYNGPGVIPNPSSHVITIANVTPVKKK